MNKIINIFIFMVILCIFPLNIFSYNATFTARDQNTQALLTNAGLELRGTNNLNNNFTLPSGSGYVTIIQSGTVFGYNIRRSGYASRYSPEYTMPSSNSSYSITLLPATSYSLNGYTKPLSYTSVSSKFGWRVLDGAHQIHTGIDIAKPVNTNIYSICDGTNVVTGFARYTEGYYVHMSSSVGYNIRYMHMNQLSNLPTSVDQGDWVGYVGTTGSSTNYHLHIDISYSSTYYDPEAFFID